MFAARKKSIETIKGLYIHGSVGRGKTMLMDMFFSMAPCQKKRRAHFFEFMTDVHNRIAAQRLKFKNGETKQADPIPPVAADLYAEAELLCFDEFTVTDIADAMILSRLFSELFSLGCVLIATSNVEPDNLYRDGLNRGLFLPFIDLLKKHVDVVTLDSPTDYRMEKLNSQPVYLTPLDQRTDMAMDASWMQALHGRKAQPMEIPMKGAPSMCLWPSTAWHAFPSPISATCRSGLPISSPSPNGSIRSSSIACRSSGRTSATRRSVLSF